MYSSRIVLILVSLLVSFHSFSQDTIPIGTALLDKLLSEEKTAEAKNTLYSHLEYLKDNNQIDSLADYVYYVGKIELSQSNKKKAEQKAKAFVESFKILSQNPAALRRIYMSMSSFYDLIGMPDKGYKSNEEALKYSLAMPIPKGSDIGTIQSNLGTSAMRLGNIKLAIEHFRQTLKYYNSDPDTNPTDYYFGYSSMGAVMYYSSKIDSSIYYYEKAVAQVKTLDSTPLNLHYRPALLLNNVAGLYSLDGQTTKSLDAMKRSLNHYNDFFKSDAEDYKKKNALKGKFQAIDNIAGIYQSLGDYHRADELLRYSFTEKSKTYEEDNPEIFKSKVLLGQSQLKLLNYEQAATLLDEGISLIEKNPGAFLSWDADAHYSRALVFEALGKVSDAANYFAKSEILFDEAFADTYDSTYLDFLKTTSVFYAKNQHAKKAIATSEKGYNYVLKHQGDNSLSAFEHALNLGDVYFKLNNYLEALTYSKKALENLNVVSKRGISALDSIRIESKKPLALLLKSKSNYELNSKKDTVFLLELYKELNEAIAILEKRKNNISDAKSISLIISENNEVYDFAKKITLELYQKTGNKKYLNKTIGYHESNIYNKIRTRLNSKDAIRFSNIPEAVLAEEKSLKSDVAKALDADENGIETYLKANDDWERFKIRLRTEYPTYFQMRYSSVEQSIESFQEKINPNVTVVKYFFIDNNLNVLVLTKNTSNLFSIDAENISEEIQTIQQEAHDVTAIGNALHRLYVKLWEPLKEAIKTNEIIIIPDGLLYNLSFEALATKPITSFNQLAENSLLSKHRISYDFSLQILARKKEFDSIRANYVGFAPGFTDTMKEEYKITVKDSVDMDFKYITLLPQPFSLDLISKANKLFGGTTFIKDNSTEENFKLNAKQHKIIHIGTHAESNNLSPELSRLVFAKNNKDKNDNYLYNYEIYNCDLSADLAVLTACETGKPTFQPGEGMISLAHAFNYAGSESMLTSLWKIDEKSSVEIIEVFYKYLAKGLPKNEALQKAKLAYLHNAEGRTLAPQYWAGLVLIGDISPIEIEPTTNWWYWIIGGLVFLILAYFRWKRVTSS